MEMSDGKITLAEWNATIDKLVEIQQARQNEGKKSIFTGGTDRKDYRTSFVVHPNQQIEFTKEEMESLYSTMGVSFASGTTTGTKNKRVTTQLNYGERITEYDASGNEIKAIYKDDSGKITKTCENEYDNSGNKIKAIYKDDSGKITETYENEYDSSGNKIKSIKKDGSGKIID
jgi:hypothetical protein